MRIRAPVKRKEKRARSLIRALPRLLTKRPERRGFE